MITQVDDKNGAKYRKLFDNASNLMIQYLKKNGDDEKDFYVVDLYDYFRKFSSIIKAAKEKDEDPSAPDGGDPQYWQKYYSILPLDEPVFTINANTRKIEVPEQFKTIGVEGDINAEIIFFTLDRFFDSMDFGSEQVIAAIEWKHSSEKEGDIDKAYIKELTTYKDKLLIGWIIDEEIANTAGSIEFALRLYVEDNKKDEEGNIILDKNGNPIKEIIYSFSTETAKINIAKTLNIYPDSDQVLDTAPTAQVLSRITSMTFPDNLWSEDTLLPPLFVDNNPESESYEQSFNIRDLVDENGNPKVYSYKLDGKDTGEFYADLGSDDTFTATVKAFSSNATDSSKLKYNWHTWNDMTKSWDPGVESTEKLGGNTLEISEVGKYKCVVKDYVSSLRFSKNDSEILRILGPETPQVKVAEQGTDYYTAIISDDSGLATLSVKPLLNDFITRNNDKNTKTQLQYIWAKAGNADGDNKGEEQVIDSNSYKVTSEGFYLGSIRATGNGKSVDSKDSTVWRVTQNLRLPGREDFSVKIGANGTGSTGYVNDTITILFNNYNYDHIQYQWYKKPYDGDEYSPVINESGQLDSSTESKITFTPTSAAQYKIKIIVDRNTQVLPVLGEGESLANGNGYSLLGEDDFISIVNRN